jgi:hypothetical protein
MRQQILALLAIAFGLVFSRLRSGYGAPGEKPIHLSQASTLVPLLAASGTTRFEGAEL